MEPNTANQSLASLIPFWFWNGRIEAAGIREQVALMAGQGVGGFFIAPRQGLEVPYLSARWFDLVRVAVEAASAHNLQVWIYDEYPYPSGMAGGAVTRLQPQARHRTLESIAFKACGGDHLRREFPQWQVLSLQAVPVDAGGGRDWSRCVDLLPHGGWLQRRRVFQKTGLTAYNDKRFFTAEPVFSLDWQVPDGQWEIHAFAEKEIEDFKYYGHYMDPCNAGAVGQFIALTHERYAAELGEHFGKTIGGFFTDETGFLGRLAWSPCLPQYFLERNGYDLIPALPALHCRDWPGYAKVRYDYWQTLHELLRERYHKRIREWCRQHGLLYIAETPSLRATTQLHADVPATDSGHEKLGASIRAVNRKNMHSLRYNPKMAASLACQRGIREVLVECFHSVGWSMTLQDAKWMVDRFFALGVNCFNPHAFFYTTDDLRKHDAPPSLFYQNPYWEHFHLLSQYMRYGSNWLKAGAPLCPIAVLDPITSIWTRMGNPMEDLAFAGTCPQDARDLARLRDDWVDLTSGLLARQRDYQHLDPEMLAQAEVKQGVLYLGEAAFSFVILPPLLNLESGAWSKLKDFAAAGGTIIGCGHLPSEAIEGKWRQTSSPAGGGIFQPEGVDPAELLDAFGLDSGTLASYWEMGAPPLERKVGKADTPWRWVPRQAYGSVDTWVEAILREADACCLPPVTVELLEPNDALLLSCRVVDARLRVFATNQGHKRIQGSLRLNSSALLQAGVDLSTAHCACSRYDLETGEAEAPIALMLSDSKVAAFSFDLDGYHAGAWEIGPFSDSVVAPSAALPLKSLTLPLKSEWELNIESDNVLRLEHFGVFVEGKCLGEASAIPFINQCAELDPQLPLDCRQVFGTPVQVGLRYPLKLRFVARWMLESLPERCAITWEEHTLGGVFNLILNDQVVGSSTEGRHFPIAHLLRKGENTLTLDGVIEADEGGLADALYLEGRFGVRLSAQELPCLTALPSRCRFPLSVYEPLPHYAGTIRLRQTSPVCHLPADGPFYLQLPEGQVPPGACLSLVLDGTCLGTRAWAPYRWTCPPVAHAGGARTVELRVCSGLEGKFEGRYFDANEHRMVSLASAHKNT